MLPLRVGPETWWPRLDHASRENNATAGFLAAGAVLDFVEEFFGEDDTEQFVDAMRDGIARCEEMEA
jgi:hypothetical protein